jgi:hypothetical protein
MAAAELFPRKPAGGSKASEPGNEFAAPLDRFRPSAAGSPLLENLKHISSLRGRGAFFGRPAETRLGFSHCRILGGAVILQGAF